MKVGYEFTDNGFLSTAMHKYNGFSSDYNFIIVVPKGPQGVFAELFSHYTDNHKFNYNSDPKKAKLWDGVSKETIYREFEWIGQRGSNLRF